MVEPTKSWKKSLRDESNPDGLNWWAEAIHMLSVWNMDLDLQTVKVGIIDSMFDITHEDFKEDKFVKVWNNPANQEGVKVIKISKKKEPRERNITKIIKSLLIPILMVLRMPVNFCFICKGHR